MQWSFLAAALLAALWMIVHAFVGGRECARPLAQDRQLPDVVRETTLLCWHLVTGCLALMALFLFLGARGYDGLALAGTAMAAMMAMVGLLLPPLRRAGYGLLPQGWLFVPVAALGAWGLAGG
ncbi:MULTISPECIES: hypothetical protein [unclassified Leisingera]|uniref:hypothetical protein n=1 Tax=unclassified Leisingera TaxID=2614906 RepID=UPI0002E7279F|nr:MULTISPECIES: hypothetical protein [unclassified Leisingera]KIC19127.1 hypothetical protein RA21_00985 [Leisingera sp. ANG-DT]KIC26475.1 hypothetical protein RA23_01645 [Leisingera sp. ANG-S3]KIC52794.1 hypothetical protein RA22_14775 [Leisingera sp. ANG-S]KID10191.1 hypothetical protein GC1_00350 [Leisingera sp. ANG1]